MSPFDLNQVSVIPIEEQERDHTCSTLSSATPPNFFDQRVVDYNRLVHHLQHPVQQDQHKELFHLQVSAGSHDPDSKTLDLFLCGAGISEEEEEEPERPGKWMPSKMRFMRKMMNSARIQEGKPGGISSGAQEGEEYPGRETSSQIISNGSSPGGGNGVIRVCSDCNTTKTPLWRSGPRGPKSLCNACGIRQRKARRAMAAAAAAAAAATLNGGVVIPPSATAYKVRKEKKLDIDIDRTLPFKKRCKVTTTTAATTTAAAAASITTTPAKKLCFDEALTSSSRSKKSAIQKVFPQEERDAAILLMTLSCGLIRS